MAAAIGVRTDCTAADLRRFSRRCDDPDQVRRLLALSLILDRGSRSEAAKATGVTLQIVRDWVIRFIADGSDGLMSRKACGKVSILNAAQRHAPAQQVEAGPIPAAHGVARWRLIDLAQGVWEFGLSITKQPLSQEMRALGFRKLSARPRHHGQKEGAIADFKKASGPSWQKSNDPCREAPR